MFDEATAYDTETSDSDPRHCQILEYGSVQLDPSTLEETGSTELDVRLMPYVVPAPEALQVCGLDAEQICDASRMAEPDAARAIGKDLRARFGVKLFITYNGIKFDDEVIRTTMFRNLMDPWVTSGARSRRLDVFHLAQLAHFCDPSIVAQGVKDDGTPTWRLQHVAPANGIALKAHRAIEDARATGRLARQIRERAPMLFDMMVGCGSAQAMLATLDPSKDEPLYMFSGFGRPSLEPVFALNFNQGQTIAARLNGNLAALHDGDVKAVAANLFKSDGAACLVKPNASPPVFTAAQVRMLGLDISGHEENRAKVRFLKDNAVVATTAASAAAASRADFAAGTTPESQIYGKFSSNEDKSRTGSFHSVPSLTGKIQVVSSLGDARLREMGARFLIVHNEATTADFEGAIGIERGRNLAKAGERAMQRPHAKAGSPWMTAAQAQDDARRLAMPEMSSWLEERFGVPGSPQAAVQEQKAGQMAFSF